jgi:hypothetical protein
MRSISIAAVNAALGAETAGAALELTLAAVATSPMAAAALLWDRRANQST